MKKILALVLVFTLILSLSVTAFAADDKIKIGISIWSSTDTLGSECKRMIDAAADVLGVETQWVDQAHISEQVTASAETLALADCDGIIICNSASAEMGSVIKTCDENEVYVAQFFRVIDKEANPDEYAQAAASPYYVRRDGHREAWKPGITGEFEQYAGFGCSLEHSEVWYTLGYENAPWMFVDSHHIQPRKTLGENCFSIRKGETG